MLERLLTKGLRFARKRMTGEALALSCLLTAMGASADTVVIKGSDTMVILNRELAAEYQNQVPGVRFDIEGRGSSTGIAALLDGSTDIAASSREIKSAERDAFEKMTGVPPREVVVALDGIGVYVHNNNPVTRLTVEQLAGILRGDITNWSEVRGHNRPIHIYNRDPRSGTRAFLQKRVLAGKPFSGRAREVSSTALLVASVARNQGAIGYGGIAYAEGAHIIQLANDKTSRAVWPDHEHVAAGSYPLSRPLYYYLNPKKAPEHVDAFVDWVLGAEGQAVVRFVGYFPAPRRAADGAAMEPTEAVEPPPVVRLTPASMANQPIRFGVSFTAEGADASGRVMIALDLQPVPTADTAVQEAVLMLGDAAEIPLSLAPDGTAHFTLRNNAVDTAALRVLAVDAHGRETVYVLPLADARERK